MSMAEVIKISKRKIRVLSLVLGMFILIGSTGCAQQTQQDSNNSGGGAVALAQADKSTTGKDATALRAMQDPLNLIWI